VLTCYLLLVVVVVWTALRLYDVLRTSLSPWYTADLTSSVETRLFVERPLVVLTLSYHAAPIYDLMDQLQPLGVRFIERGINAYACQYFNTCRRHDPLKVKLYYLTRRDVNKATCHKAKALYHKAKVKAKT